jgi:ATP-dependent DNA ligase
MPAVLEPMLCTLLAEPFDHPGWIFEPKYDGLRILARYDGKRLTLLSRYGDPQDFQFPDVVEALGKALDRPAIVDGEVVCFDEQGRTRSRATAAANDRKTMANHRGTEGTEKTEANN